MKTIAPQDRPREKLDRSGAGALGDNELLAVVIGHGQAGRTALDLANCLLTEAGGVHGLTRMTRDELAGVPGVGEAQASRVLAAVELGRRTVLQPPVDRPQFLSAARVAAFLLPEYGAFPVERFGVMLLDAKYRLLRVRLLSVGTLDASLVHPREVYRAAIAGGAVAVVVFHNHPSGDPTPSIDDVKLTHRLIAAGEIMGIELADHLILADTRYCSFKEAQRA